ncbi:sulfatase-like hydrolase/transferase [Ravibacter arvi]|uniref:Sulfatase-like hydrolase/transferase n=1 Tax=Ravibacter arvi TaxID=2051041 RepID=A0ABP8LNH5_9BACT
MKKRLLLILSAFFPTCLPGLSQGGATEKKPNVILIMADDLGYEMLGCYGNQANLTPNLDRLSASGMKFERCYSTPLCTPSRVQLMTGKYNHRNYTGFGLLDPKETTFGHMMRRQGYKTGITGKWQLYGNERQRQLAGGKTGTLPADAGFDEFCLWQVDTLGSRYKTPTVYTDNGNSVTLEGKYGPDVFNEFALSFIDKHRNEPFFLYYPMCLTHAPFEATPFSSDFSQSTREDPKYFDDMVRYMDHLIGNVVKRLTELRLLENTMIVFIGDNGTDKTITFEINGRKRKGEKGTTTDGGIHAPMLVSWKGRVTAGTTSGSLIDFTDFVPTLLQVSGARADAYSGLDGVSFYPLLLGERSKERKWVFCHYAPNWGNYQPKTFALDTRWKVYSTGEVFDLGADPDEKKPLSPEQLSRTDKKDVGRLRQVIKRMYQ